MQLDLDALAGRALDQILADQNVSAYQATIQTCIQAGQELENKRLENDQRRFEMKSEMLDKYASEIVGPFKNANVIVLFSVAALALIDFYLVLGKVISPADRLVSSEVIMALVGATTVQLGASMLVVAKGLFQPKN